MCCQVCNRRDNREREGFHPRRWVVMTLPGAKQGSEPKVNVAMGVQTRVRGPQCGIRLPNASYGVLHCPSADREVAGRQFAGPVALCEELENRYWVAGPQGVGAEAQAGTKGCPEVPSGRRGLYALRTASVGSGCLDKAPISEEAKAGCRGSICHEAVCGKVASK